MFRLSGSSTWMKAHLGVASIVSVAICGPSVLDEAECAWWSPETGDGWRSSATRRSKAGRMTTPIECEDGTQVLPWSCPSREEQLDELKAGKEFDVLVVGAGAVGCGVALDASTRGLSVALVEREDIASGTSGRSSKLIHGGVRYLEAAFKKLDITMWNLVTEALEERAHLLEAAPYMNKALPIMIPLYNWWEVPYMWVGTMVYDLIAGENRTVPKSSLLSRTEALFRFPMLQDDNLKGAIIYYDGQMNDTRMAALVALTAVQNGARVGNYVNVVSLTHDSDGKCNGAIVQDQLSGESWEIAAKVVVNATGPFTDSVRKMDKAEAPEIIVPAGGVHIILPDHFSPETMGLIVPKTKDGRVLFFLPWEGSTLCGTTDHPTDLTMRPKSTEQEISFILDECNRHLNKRIRREDVRAAWCGIRGLVRNVNAASNTKEMSRNHVVEVSDSGMVTITGGKWTTYRRMAEDAVNAVLDIDSSLTAIAGPCKTYKMPVLGADRMGIVVGRKFDRVTITLREVYGFDRDVASHLTSNYGTRALQIAELAKQFPELNAKIARPHPYICAEVIFAIEQEMACTLVDVIARRTRLAFLDQKACQNALPQVAQLMAKHLKWDKERVEAELNSASKFLDTMG